MEDRRSHDQHAQGCVFKTWQGLEMKMSSTARGIRRCHTQKPRMANDTAVLERLHSSEKVSVCLSKHLPLPEPKLIGLCYEMIIEWIWSRGLLILATSVP